MIVGAKGYNGTDAKAMVFGKKLHKRSKFRALAGVGFAINAEGR